MTWLASRPTGHEEFETEQAAEVFAAGKLAGLPSMHRFIVVWERQEESVDRAEAVGSGPLAGAGVGMGLGHVGDADRLSEPQNGGNA